MTRKYFTKAVAPVKVRKIRPNYTGKTVFALDQYGVSQSMSARAVAQQQGRSKAGRLGVGHKWTSAEASKAAKKLWKTRQRKVHGIRIGLRSKRQPRTDRWTLRGQYALNPDSNPQNIWYDPFNRTWQAHGTVLSERTALIRLGHLRSQHGFVPRVILGTSIVPTRRQQ